MTERVVLARDANHDLVAHTPAEWVPWSGWSIRRRLMPLEWLGLCGAKGTLCLDRGIARDACGCIDCDVVEVFGTDDDT